MIDILKWQIKIHGNFNLPFHLNVASKYIQNAVDKGRLGFKSKHVRC